MTKNRRIYNRAWRKAHPNYRKKWEKANPTYQKDKYKASEVFRRRVQCRHFMREYGISLTDVRNLSKSQKHRCLICDKKKKLVVDHDHETGKVRGLLCMTCNASLYVFDDKKIFNKILKYLRTK